MFVRARKSGKFPYLQLVQNPRVDGRVRQPVLATLGRRDVRQATGQIGAWVASFARFAEQTVALETHQQGKTQAAATIKIGPPLVVERIWRELGLAEILERLFAERKFQFAVERALFVTVRHRLFDPGRDRAAKVSAARVRHLRRVVPATAPTRIKPARIGRIAKPWSAPYAIR